LGIAHTGSEKANWSITMSQVFAFQSRQIRTITENNQPWFAAMDVCRALNIPWRGNTLTSIPDEWKRTMRKFRMEGFATRDLVIISEPAVYKLAFRSNKPEADAFTNWVASEVLPTIRKTGKYEAAPQQAALPAPMPEEDAGKWFRQVREDLQLAIKILDVHTAAWFRLLQSGRTSQLHVMQQCNRHINRAQSGITTALAELREANRFARMLAESAGTGGHVVPLVKIGG